MFKRHQERVQFVSTKRRKSSRRVSEVYELVPHTRRRSRIVKPLRRKFASVPFSTIR